MKREGLLQIKLLPSVMDAINHASIKPGKDGIQSFLVGEHMETKGEWCPREGMEVPCPFPLPCPLLLFHLAVAELRLFIIS